jgi:hypothetical protein
MSDQDARALAGRTRATREQERSEWDTDKRYLKRFLEYLSNGDPVIVLSYWNPIRNELMPIAYTDDDLIANFEHRKKPVSGKVKLIR